MNNEEKILAILEKHGAMLESLNDRMDEMQEKLNSRMDRMDSRMDKMQDDLTCVRLRLELDVEKRFDAVNEGIDAILEKTVPQSRVEALEDDVIVLKTAVKTLSQKQKKAQ